ncbi:uncharacterized protein FIBRA_06375 [Fibroporia radiculosa]|uniref:rRNA biogenesis protein RRP5 n=1 Tax=Fibroporia radiculosa TaxID=599839 RepID=J4H416_9APHY|nr:uncharacterized protein FIBRA_06375 [Fibroporia radiculosa]CCM04209.1 predicted protein [Fibroporia radiculosa]
MVASKKRVLDDAPGNPRSKKTRTESTDKKGKSKADVSLPAIPEEVDFPRGGGTSFTPLEVKAIRAEAVKEADKELFEDKPTKRKRRKSDIDKAEHRASKDEKSEKIRVEHLNYKRVTVGMKILGQVVSVESLALIISLPNQLFAHVPITEISTQLTALLEEMGEVDDASSSDEEEGSGTGASSSIPELFQMFRPGSYVRAIVSAIHLPGATDTTPLGRIRDEAHKASRRIELSLVPEKVNAGVSKADLRAGFTMSAAVKSKEDHGYILDLGVSDINGFLSFKDAKQGPFENPERIRVGHLLDISISKTTANGRTCTCSVNASSLMTASLSEVTNASSILPGTQVQSLVTAVLPDGLNLQIMGYFGGTIDQFHLLPGHPERNYKMGQKLKARVLYAITATPPKFALSLASHVLKLVPKDTAGMDDGLNHNLDEIYPTGSILDAVKVIRVESERGLVVEVASGVEGFVHISHTSDEHVPTLSSSSGPWKVGTVHRARVTGHFHFDGLLQLSLRPSVLEQKFLQVGEVQVGEVLKGAVKRLTDSAMFVSISGSVDGVIWPNHYADIQLKQPQRRFKPGGSIKCRVLVVDTQRQRIVLTAKKTLLESALPIISKFEDARVGLVTHAVVFRASDKSLQVEFYNNVKAVVPAGEASETAVGLSTAFPIGKPVQVRIMSIDPETSRIVASIRQTAPNYLASIENIASIGIGDTVEGDITEVQNEKAIVTLRPSQVRTVISLNNLANRRGVSVAQLRASLQVGEKLQDLVVVSRNPERGFVRIATKPKEKITLAQKIPLDLATIQIGQIVQGRVLHHGRRGALVKLTNTVSGTLHPTDVDDDFESGKAFPPADYILKAVVIAVDKDRRQLTLSTRPSRLQPRRDEPVIDPEIASIGDLKEGETIRGFIKQVAEHGIFVTLGREIDARVQIKELFDEYVKDWKSRFVAHQLVRGRILRVDIAKKQVEMTFRSGDLKTNSLTLADLSEGQKVDGCIKRTEEYGLFIQIEGSKLTGLCHKSELSDNKDANVTLALRSFREGDQVKAIILSIDEEKRRISLGLKPSYFVDDDFQSNNDVDDENEESSEEDNLLGIVEGSQGDDDSRSHQDNQDDMDADVIDDSMNIDMSIQLDADQSPSDDRTDKELHISVPSLNLQQGFQWSVASNVEVDDDMQPSSEDEDVEDSQQKRKRKRKEIEQDLTADMHTKVPESNTDFERVLLGSPNSSYLWIQYMSFQLQISEVDKAREIAKRALRTINFREEQEKMNIWIALLNLENTYGTEETLETTFRDAARHNDSETIHLRLASILDQSGKTDRAEEQYQRTCKKFGQSSDVWTLCGEHYLRHGKLEEARKLLPRSLQSLEKHDHLKTISKFAQLEYKLGDPERGKTLFEGIVDSHSKRWDMWSIYIDMEAGQGDMMSLRNIFDRVLAIKMTSHKAKSFFKKWLELERRMGDEEGASAVKAKAVEWTQRASASS